MKTKKQWDKSGTDFSKFCKAGDQIDENIYYYFFGEVYPVRMSTHAFLMGEPNSKNEDGEFAPEDQNPFNTIDLQPFIGFQFDFSNNIKVDLRFAYSVLPIRAVQGVDGTNYYLLNNQFNNVISLALYYRFDR